MVGTRLRDPRERQFAREALRNLVMLGTGAMPSHALRRAAYSRLGLTFPRSARIHRGLELLEGHRVAIGERTIIGTDCLLDGRGGLTIGDDVNLSAQVAVWTAQHDPQAADFASVTAPVAIRRRAWVSFRVVILPGVTVGEGAVVAAGGVVTKDVAPFTVVGGIPATKISDRNRELTYLLDGHPGWLT
jgi:acetyltransferase-like isoleucine patch superfamily enzyme